MTHCLPAPLQEIADRGLACSVGAEIVSRKSYPGPVFYQPVIRIGRRPVYRVGSACDFFRAQHVARLFHEALLDAGAKSELRL